MPGRRTIVLAACLLALLAPPALAQEDPLPDGCESHAAGAVCQWRFDNRESGALSYSFPVPIYARMLATMTLVQEGADAGWRLTLVGPDGEAIDEHEHTRRSESTTVVRTNLQTLVLDAPNASGTLELTLLSDGVGIDGMNFFTGGAVGMPSLGAFTVTYIANVLPPGVVPLHPAATRSDPHLVGAERDARRGAYDQVAAWFDDAALGDGLFEAHVATSDLTDWSWKEGGKVAIHALEFRVLDVSYYLWWNLGGPEPALSLDAVEVSCGVSRVDGPANYENILRPACSVDWDNSTVRASLPESAVGSPGDGALFTNLRAYSKERTHTSEAGYSSPMDTIEDEMTGARYAFALGGPAIWDELNPRLAIPPPIAPAWYEAPLTKENVPDTLQVVGAILAAATFIAGLIMVRRHRRQTRALLARIDALTAQHEREAHAGLLALGAFESEITALYREGRLTDAQYQLLTQRVSGAAARFALRHGLGLDDGAPS